MLAVGVLLGIATFAACGGVAFPFAFAPRGVHTFTYADGYDRDLTLDLSALDTAAIAYAAHDADTVTQPATAPAPAAAANPLATVLTFITKRRAPSAAIVDDAKHVAATGTDGASARAPFFGLGRPRSSTPQAPVADQVAATTIVEDLDDAATSRVRESTRRPLFGLGRRRPSTPAPPSAEAAPTPAVDDAGQNAAAIVNDVTRDELAEAAKTETPATQAASQADAARDHDGGLTDAAQIPHTASAAAIEPDRATASRETMFSRITGWFARKRPAAPARDVLTPTSLQTTADRPIGFDIMFGANADAPAPDVTPALPLPVLAAEPVAVEPAAASEPEPELSPVAHLSAYMARNQNRGQQTVENVAHRFVAARTEPIPITYDWASEALKSPEPIAVPLQRRRRLLQLYGTLPTDSAKAMLQRVIVEDPELADEATTLLHAHG